MADSNNVGARYEAPGDSSTVWRQATEYEVVLTKMLFADFARLGGFVVCQNFFFSQYGTLYSRRDSLAVNAANCQTLYGLDYNENISDDESDWDEWIGNDNGPGNVPYAFLDPNDPAAASVGEDELKFKPSRIINAATGEEWSAGGNFVVDAQGGVTMQNATIRNAAFFHRVKSYRLYGGSVNLRVFDNELYELGVTPHFVADTFILYGDNTDASKTIAMVLPDPRDAVGMRLKVVRGYHTASHRATIMLLVAGSSQTVQLPSGPVDWANGIYDPDTASTWAQYDITQLAYVELTVGSALMLYGSFGDITEQYYQWVITAKG